MLLRNFCVQITEYTIIGLNSEHFYYLAEQGKDSGRMLVQGQLIQQFKDFRGPGTTLLKFSCLSILERTETIWLLRSPKSPLQIVPLKAKRRETVFFLLKWKENFSRSYQWTSLYAWLTNSMTPPTLKLITGKKKMHCMIVFDQSFPWAGGEVCFLYRHGNITLKQNQSFC